MRLHLKSLLTTSALVAVAAAGNAQTFSGTSTTQATMTGANPSATFVTGASWNVTTTSAFAISGTGNGTININTGATVSSSHASGTFVGGGLSSLTVNNSGTLVNSNASGPVFASDAISTTATINNAGTISGTTAIQIGGGTVTINNNGTINGAISGTTNNGTNTININANSVLNGNIATLNSSDTLNVTGGLLNGNVNLGGGNDILSITNGTVSGTIDLGAGTNTLNISGSSPFTSRGAMSNVGTLNISNSTATFNHALTGTSFNANTGSKAVFNVSGTLSGALTSSGTVQIGSAANLTAASANLSGGQLTVDVASSTQAGRLTLTAGGTASSTRVFVNMLATSSNIASGTALTVVAGSATSSGTLVNAAQEGVYRYALASSGNNLLVNIGRVSASSVVTGDANKALANAFESLTPAQVTGSLVTVQNQINGARSASALADVLDSLNPALSGLSAASVGVTNATGGQVSNRLASLRQGVATGSAAADKHFWVEGFGNTNSQDDKDGTRGYDSTGGGMTFGIDTDSLVNGMNVGAAFSYGLTNVESNSTLSNETDIDSYVLTGYASKNLSNDIFVNGMVGVGANRYEMERVVAGVGTAKASPDGWQGTVKAEVGRDMKVGGWKLTPTAGAQYTHLKVDSYTETGVGAAGLTVDPEKLNALDLSLAGRAAYDFDVAGGTLTPAFRAGVTTRAGDTGLDSTSRFIGGGSAFATPGIDADRTSFNLGTGVMFATMAGTELNADYDANLNDSATGHTVKLKLRMPF